MPLRETVERSLACFDPPLRHPGDVGHRARPEGGLSGPDSLLPEPRDLALDLTDGGELAQWRLHERPSRCISSSDPCGPQVPAA